MNTRIIGHSPLFLKQKIKKKFAKNKLKELKNVGSQFKYFDLKKKTRIMYKGQNHAIIYL